jgi:hypothetical protein
LNSYLRFLVDATIPSKLKFYTTLDLSRFLKP